MDTHNLSRVLNRLRDLTRGLGGALVSHFVPVGRSQFLSLSKRFVASRLSFKTKLNSGVAVESSLSIRDETSDGVRVA